MTDTLDPTIYVHCPQLDVAGSLSLGKALLVAAPHGASAGVKRAAHALHAGVVALEDAFKASGAITTLEDMRALDHALDVAWGAFHDRLSAHAALPEKSKARGTALAISAELFPTGMVFLKLNYPSEYAESDKHLAVVKKHEKDLDALVGPEFIAAVRAAHAAYGKGLGITEAKPAAPAAPNLREPLDAFRAAVGKYAVQLLAYADDHAAAAKKALAPIDSFRPFAARKRTPAEGASTTSPGPSLPPDAPAPTSPIPSPPA